MDRIALENDEAPRKKADSHHNGCRHPQWVKSKNADVGSVDVCTDDDKEAGTEANQAKRASACSLARDDRALGADEPTQDHRKQKFSKHHYRRIDELFGTKHTHSICLNPAQLPSFGQNLWNARGLHAKLVEHV